MHHLSGLAPKSLHPVVLLAVLLALSSALAARADAYIYWANRDDDEIVRSRLGPSDPLVAGASGPHAVAVDPGHVYWSNFNSATIGRANLDGSGVDQSFITGASGPGGVAVDAAHLYWANLGTDTIGRANLDGSGVNHSFISGANDPWGVAADSAHVYWVNQGTGSIGRANLDGSGIDQRFITDAGSPVGLAVDAASIYWTNPRADTIARANLDGSGVDPSFIPGLRGPVGVAVDAQHLYWSNFGTVPTTGAEGIGRADLDGSGVDQEYITLSCCQEPMGIAVDPLGTLPSSNFSFVNVSQNRRRGTAKLSIVVFDPGTLVLSSFTKKKPRVKTATAVASDPDDVVTLVVKPANNTQRRLTGTGKVWVAVEVTFTPTGGFPQSERTAFHLIKR